jgi:GT2 family glycosyltransferase
MSSASPSPPHKPTAVIVTWNCEQTLARCLAALAGEVSGIVAVDNASADRSVEVARDLGAQVIELDSNRGFASAVNVGLRKCTTDLLLLINPDVVVEPGAVARCAAELLDDPAIGIVGANLVHEDGRPDLAAARRFRTLGLLVVETFGLASLSRRLDVQYFPRWDRTTSRDVPCVNGAFMLLRRELIEAIGGLDGTVFLFLEDQELCRQVRARGLRVRFVADARALHIGSASIIAARDDQQRAVYLHRIDASVELVRREQGAAAAAAALLLWTVRCGIGAIGAAVRSDGARRQRYVAGLRWLVRQVRGREAPPPVPG